MQVHGDWQVVGPVKPIPPHCPHRAAPPEAAEEVVAAEVVVLVEVVEVRRVVDEVALVELEEPPVGGLTTDPALKVELMAPTLMLE